MKNTELNFKHQKIYVGIDVHKNNWYITIIINGMKVKELSIDPSPRILYEYLKKHYPNGDYYSVYEAGYSGYWAHRELCSLGIKNIIVNPADVPTKSKERRRKTDKVDSEKLARELSGGNLECIYIPTEKEEALRTLVRLRRQLVIDQTRIKNRIKSLLLFLGEKVPEDVQNSHWSQKYVNAIKDLPISEAESKETLENLLNFYENIKSQITEVMRQVKKHIENDEKALKTVRLLMSIPGIGFTVAVILYSEIIDIRRFTTLNELATYVGLAPLVYSSGEKEKVLGLSNQRNKYLRNYLIESSWMAIRKDPALLMKYGELIRRMSKQKAIIRISKKLLNRIRYVWINEEPYVIGVIE